MGKELGVLEPAFTIKEQACITSPKGFKAAGIHAGIKRKRLDLGAIVCEVDASAAAVYTVNAFQAAPIKVTQDSLGVAGKLRGVVVNSGNANACTGQQGVMDAYAMRAKLAEQLGCPAHLVAVASTGVIGVMMPMEKVTQGIEELMPTLKERDTSFAEAILTTDTCTKQVEVTLEIEGKPVTIAGVAKGSGMIKPNMATMLAFVTTDAVIESEILQSLLWKTTDETFNMITVDGDTSTNDMVLVMASGKAAHAPLDMQHAEWAKFQQAFQYVCRELAKMIARDGEGATRLVEVVVEGADHEQEAQKIAKAVVGSSLVKTAVFGADPNWGRILCAVGYGAPSLRPESIDVYLGQVKVVEGSVPLPFDEEKAQVELKQEKVVIRLHLNRGHATATAWGCDLTYEYVRINASYRT
ncbi:bifunctional glutamate N-acetyltransferase/amino-acid acetyltransferase ArgJ [Laceyella putida]|uniref:Arginine biosynthesis bifunctional protein ArgJ n=1 Tax=Laceyella putida TaxID=110101 RepID=A0ABW2RGE5_9BACL